MTVESLADLLAGYPFAVLLFRMLLVGGFVIAVAILAEKLGPFLGAMVASLPLYTGPVYLMLALEHDAGWIRQAMLGSLAICGATPVFIIVYCLLAADRTVAVSVGGALLAWTVCALGVQAHTWSLPEAIAFVTPIYAVSIFLGRYFTRGISPARTERRWPDLVVRAGLCASFSGLTIWVSNMLPPQVSGVLSVVPLLLTSLAIVLHRRVGGAPTAALMAHSLTGLVGMVIAFATAHVAIQPLGVWPALGTGLAITVVWNLSLITAKGALARLRA